MFGAIPAAANAAFNSFLFLFFLLWRNHSPVLRPIYQKDAVLACSYSRNYYATSSHSHFTVK